LTVLFLYGYWKRLLCKDLESTNNEFINIPEQSRDNFARWGDRDGAIGTELDKHGLMGRAGNNLDNPEVVLEIQREYARCGCHALTTNTLTMNRIYIETHNIDMSVRDVNRAGVELAKQAVNSRQFVLGDISSTGQLLEPYGNYKEQQFYDAFKEQAEILAEAGVDGFIIETMFDLREVLCALRACKDNFSLVVVASIAFATEEKGGRTMMGNSAEDCAKSLTDAGVDVVGANCGELSPSQMAVIVSMLKSATTVPILVQPNAGKPKLINDKTYLKCPRNLLPKVFPNAWMPELLS
jgi:5-methyltetrahydrofolate--homocysteine methyltransferase